MALRAGDLFTASGLRQRCIGCRILAESAHHRRKQIRIDAYIVPSFAGKSAPIADGYGDRPLVLSRLDEYRNLNPALCGLK